MWDGEEYKGSLERWKDRERGMERRYGRRGIGEG